MRRLFAVLVLSGLSAKAQTITETFGSGANQFSIEFVTIGNPRNAADTAGQPNPAGGVDYVYNLGKYEISRDMIEKANAAAGLGITMPSLSGLGANEGNRPAVGISWYEAAKFVNFLNASQGYCPAYKINSNGTLELWSQGESLGNNRYRHKNAHYFLPSLDEWYKGAYYDPKKPGGGGYWKYPTKSNSAPKPVGEGVEMGTAVYLQGPKGYAYVTRAGGLSAYGTMGQGGNVWEWTESASDGLNDSNEKKRVLRGGGSFCGSSSGLWVGHGIVAEPCWEHSQEGFRVASRP